MRYVVQINQDLHGKTPLHCACSGCDIETFKKIIDLGGNLANHPKGEQADYVHFAVCMFRSLPPARSQQQPGGDPLPS